jgi:hypothetical protein
MAVEESETGNIVEVEIRNRRIKTKVVALPFYQREHRRTGTKEV